MRQLRKTREACGKTLQRLLAIPVRSMCRVPPTIMRYEEPRSTVERRVEKQQTGGKREASEV
jgi:hypothetical protein